MKKVDVFSGGNIILTTDISEEDVMSNGDIKAKIIINNKSSYFLNGKCIDGEDMTISIYRHIKKIYPVGSTEFNFDDAVNGGVVIQRIDSGDIVRWYPFRLDINEFGKAFLFCGFQRTIRITKDDIPDPEHLRMMGSASPNNLFYTLSNFHMMDEFFNRTPIDESGRIIPSTNGLVQS